MTEFDGFVNDGIFLPSCKEYLVLKFAALYALGEETIGYMIKPLYKLEHPAIA